MKCFKNFDQNSGGQPQYFTTQLQDSIVSNKVEVKVKTRILIRILISKELCSHLFLQIGKDNTITDDSRNLMEFFKDFDQNPDGKF